MLALFSNRICRFLVLNWFSPQPVLLSFDAEVQKMTSLGEENEQLSQLVRDKSFLCWLIFHPNTTLNLVRLSLFMS